jgi:alpha,alpha-trehalase
MWHQNFTLKTIRKVYFFIILILVSACDQIYQSSYYQPDEDLGTLFHEVQTNRIFADSKTFVDCTPQKSPQEIIKAFKTARSSSNFNLENFLKENFIFPQAEFELYSVDPTQRSMEDHIAQHWNYLTRKPNNKDEKGTLLHLPYSYVVPGGRFREIYYWDSYFTMLGLAVSGQEQLLENMLKNFAYLIDNYGKIPNGNRTYFLSRSQPPFFSSMVMLYAEVKGLQAATTFLPQLEKEYNFWMNGKDDLVGKNNVINRVVRLDDGSVLNRYWDEKNTPRPESYHEDVHVAETISSNEKSLLFRNIRAACESGWDFSSRWFKDAQNLNTIITTEILPVDLNSLLFHLEKTLGILHEKNGNSNMAEFYMKAAQDRKNAIQKYFWNSELGFFMDYNFIEHEHTSVKSLAGVFPLYYHLADEKQAKSVAEIVKKEFLKDGGVVTTLNETGQQWDYPNGWAPLQWITIKGLEKYNQENLANDITKRWLSHNEAVYKRTGKLMEKYNVVEINHEGGGGEYPLQDGFGWTNGVNIALIRN